MSKRKNMQSRRRQIRRALNRAGDIIQRIGVGKVNGLHYGCGLAQSDVRFAVKGEKGSNDGGEVFY